MFFSSFFPFGTRKKRTRSKIHISSHFSTLDEKIHLPFWNFCFARRSRKSVWNEESYAEKVTKGETTRKQRKVKSAKEFGLSLWINAEFLVGTRREKIEKVHAFFTNKSKKTHPFPRIFPFFPSKSHHIEDSSFTFFAGSEKVFPFFSLLVLSSTLAFANTRRKKRKCFKKKLKNRKRFVFLPRAFLSREKHYFEQKLLFFSILSNQEEKERKSYLFSLFFQVPKKKTRQFTSNFFDEWCAKKCWQRINTFFSFFPLIFFEKANQGKKEKVTIYAFKRTAYLPPKETQKTFLPKRDANGRSKVLNLLPKRPLLCWEREKKKRSEEKR